MKKNRSGSSWINKWSITVVVILAIIGGWLALGQSSGVPVETIRPLRGPIAQYVDEQGKTRLPRTYEITMPLAGRIEAIALEPGDPVKKGETVARLVQSDLQNELDQAKAAVERLTASIAENADTTVEDTSKTQASHFVESMKSTVEAAKSRMVAGKSRLDYAITFLGRVQTLIPSGAKTEDELDRAQLRKVEADTDYQQDILIFQAMKSIDAATLLLPTLVQQYIDRKDLTIAVLKQEKLEAEARLRQAQTNVQRGTMISPIDGVVLERSIVNEQQLAAGTQLLTIGNLHELEVEADLLSQDAVNLHHGSRALIYGAAVGRAPENGLEGVVERIRPAGFTKRSSLGVDQQRVKVIVRLRSGELEKIAVDRTLGVDYRVQVRAIEEEKEDALTIPRACLFRAADGSWQVMAVRDDVARLVRVEVGLINDRFAEITANLKPEDLVILAPDSSLHDGDAVRAIEQN
ncbi:HlyD family efflux transporter periplasmic adaptor subunit [Blastopirellula sp. J2-11]|uniref:efflux RND transporter periplasmic adaptor subunit n=1 Tax=Blastopirellula sp. J2-11 TaxID=2943192 RepID=UPI0021C98A85|nr:HlyD family efflux transporter periplasmic adaptor subunit [Blastopirellula sp. J2-11]UUO06287.1 HlyD family efflux transporter periplasmic adaptor subunit [Blastopirellula sp. J2-11]